MAYWLIVLAASCFAASADTVVLHTICGPMRGNYNKEIDVASFLGVPYACMWFQALSAWDDNFTFSPHQTRRLVTSVGRTLRIVSQNAGKEP